jgi:hypothetical protein
MPCITSSQGDTVLPKHICENFCIIELGVTAKNPLPFVLRLSVSSIPTTIPASLVTYFTGSVPARTGIPHRIIHHIRIPIEPTRTPRLRHNRIRTNKPPQPRRVIPRFVIHQAEAGLMALAGEGEVGQGSAVGPILDLGLRILDCHQAVGPSTSSGQPQNRTCQGYGLVWRKKPKLRCC